MENFDVGAIGCPVPITSRAGRGSRALKAVDKR
jgi:hypothetical protein